MLNLLVQPLGILLKFIYGMVGNYGLSIVVFTVLVKLSMVPLTFKQTKSMNDLQAMQPKLKEIKDKYKNDQEKLNAKTLELYKEQNVSPYGGCLPLLIQFPIIIGLFTVSRSPELYVFASEEIYHSISTSFLWLNNLVDPDPWILPLLAGLTTYLTSITAATNNNWPKSKSFKLPNAHYDLLVGAKLFSWVNIILGGKQCLSIHTANNNV